MNHSDRASVGKGILQQDNDTKKNHSDRRHLLMARLENLRWLVQVPAVEWSLMRPNATACSDLKHLIKRTADHHGSYNLPFPSKLQSRFVFF